MIILPSNASLLLTEDCNLACTYCFEKHNKNKMTKKVAKRTVDWLAENAIKNRQFDFSIMLFGGEPLLNIDVIETIFEYGLIVAKKFNLRFTCSMVTNATVMNDRIYSVLKKYRDAVNLNIQLSVDGTEEVHNRYRITKGGKGSFDLVRKNIPIFKDIYDNNIEDKRLSIHGCINKETLPKLSESYMFFRHVLGFKQIWFLPIAEEKWDSNDVKIYREQNEIIFEDYSEELILFKDINNSFNYAPFSRYDCLDNRSYAPCGAGRSFVTVTADGEIYPCHQIYFNDEYKDTNIGNIWDGIDEDRRRIFVEYEEEDIGCQDCKNTQCYRCLAANWVHNGNMFSQIRGFYCNLSSIDNYFQRKLRNIVNKMSHFMNNNNENIDNKEPVDCLCNSREGASINGCDIVVNQNNCQSGNNPDNPGCLCDINEHKENDS